MQSIAGTIVRAALRADGEPIVYVAAEPFTLDHARSLNRVLAGLGQDALADAVHRATLAADQRASDNDAAHAATEAAAGARYVASRKPRRGATAETIRARCVAYDERMLGVTAYS